MGFITESWPVDIVMTLSALTIALYFFLTSTYNYWKDKKVPFAEPVVGFGSNFDMIRGKRGLADIISHIYKQFKDERFCGFYQFRQPSLLVRDPNLISHVLIKDFSYFVDRTPPIDNENEPLTMNLVNLSGDRWRGLRHKLSSTFSTGKLKGMIDQMCNCGKNFLKTIDNHAKTREDVELSPIVAVFSRDVIASCAFGLEMNPGSLEEKRFIETVNKAFGSSVMGTLRLVLKIYFPMLANLFCLSSFDPEVTDYFVELTKATIKHRQQNNIKRDDFFQMLLALKQKDETGEGLDSVLDKFDEEDIQLQYTEKSVAVENSLKFTDEIVAAQTFIFYAAGSESTSITSTIALHYIAEYPKVQRRLQEEVDCVLAKHNGQWSYQTLKDMTYLDQVIQESQRMVPIAYQHVRVCTSPYRIPGSDVVIDKGVAVVIPTQCLHRDPKYYPNPDVFDPDRFEGNNFKPSPVFNPFGDGPRMCIAMRFAVLEMKVLISQLISKYCMHLSPKTKIPLRLDPKSGRAQILGGIWVSFQARTT